MSEDAFDRETYEERRRKWRRSGFWRGIFVSVLVLAALIGAGAYFAGDGRPAGPHIARYEISGMIFDDGLRDYDLAEIAEDDNARALILTINSGGGTTVGSEALYEAIRKVAAEKPVVAQMGEAAASGAYITALAADHIVARGNTLTGSIGVIMQVPNVTELLDDVGIDMVTVRSSDVKGGPSPFLPDSAQQRAVSQALIADSQEWFLGLVAERRNMTAERAAEVGDGRVYTGRMALELGLVDAIGGEDTVLSYLGDVDPEFDDLPIRNWQPTQADEGVFPSVSTLLRDVRSEADTWLSGFRLMSVAR